MKTPPADVAAGLGTNEPDLLCRSSSSRNRLAAPHRAEAASLGDGECKNEHGATLEQEVQPVKILRLAQRVEFGRCSIVSSKTNRS
ncbi:hypothetical protein FJV76_25830 [Mesorhizobium sp. WSM4303]|uniref:hypothetical protein n=1 Tax=unclassified Mesorhizobium TaxID=325217 RepID=UPI00115F2294|nr:MULTISPECIES: hypothetical protein [unclassified Mesorhizobium]TRC90864.1 hypothetical protein FJV77_27575 [Mesorhizobium sp. WSM4306]TRC98579.1 hypothetical protein FJV76_25830 [Mesorhizobium sp. WSM4303]